MEDLCGFVGSNRLGYLRISCCQQGVDDVTQSGNRFFVLWSVGKILLIDGGVNRWVRMSLRQNQDMSVFNLESQL